MTAETPIPRFVGAQKLPNRRRLIAAGIFMCIVAVGFAIVAETVGPGTVEAGPTAATEPGDTPETSTTDAEVERAQHRERLESLVDDAVASQRRAREAIEAARAQGFDPEYVDSLEGRLAPREPSRGDATPRPAPTPIEVIPVLPADGRAL